MQEALRVVLLTLLLIKVYRVPKPRNYKRERQLQSTPVELAKNAARKRARRKLEKEGVVKKGDGKDVDHKNRNPMDNGRKNLKAKPKSSNRSFSRKGTKGVYGKKNPTPRIRSK